MRLTREQMHVAKQEMHMTSKCPRNHRGENAFDTEQNAFDNLNVRGINGAEMHLT